MTSEQNLSSRPLRVCEPITVLVVDDSPEDRSAVRWYLEADAFHRFEVREATGAAEGLKAVLSNPPDCLVLDFYLPGMDALQFLQRLAGRSAPLPLAVVVLTGSGDEELADLCLRRGAQDFLSKDLEMGAHLSRAIRGSVQRFRLAQERDRAETARQESESRFQTLAEVLPSLLFTTDGAGCTRYTNRRFHEYTGLAAESLLGTGWMRVIHPDDLPIASERWARAVASEEAYEAEYRFRRADGVYRWFLCRAVPFRRADGIVTQWFGAWTDIEEHKRAEGEIRRSNDDLRQFASAAAHDLQEPLRMLITFTQMLERRLGPDLDETSREFIDYAADGARQIHRLVAGLRTYWEASEPDRHPPETLDGNEEVAYLLQGIDAEITRCSAVITVDPLPVVSASRERLWMALRCLLDNALKYHKPGEPPRIHLSAARQGHTFVFTVRDEGIGIHPSHHQRIFGIFKKLDRYGPGSTGMGLAFAAQAVARLGGRLWVESQEGKGAAFHFTIHASEGATAGGG